MIRAQPLGIFENFNRLLAPKTRMTTSGKNPLLESWTTPFEAPPFDYDQA